jgi:hypothetical protein
MHCKNFPLRMSSVSSVTAKISYRYHNEIIKSGFYITIASRVHFEENFLLAGNSEAAGKPGLGGHDSAWLHHHKTFTVNRAGKPRTFIPGNEPPFLCRRREAAQPYAL